MDISASPTGRCGGDFAAKLPLRSHWEHSWADGRPDALVSASGAPLARDSLCRTLPLSTNPDSAVLHLLCASSRARDRSIKLPSGNYRAKLVLQFVLGRGGEDGD